MRDDAFYRKAAATDQPDEIRGRIGDMGIR